MLIILLVTEHLSGKQTDSMVQVYLSDIIYSCTVLKCPLSTMAFIYLFIYLFIYAKFESMNQKGKR